MTTNANQEAFLNGSTGKYLDPDGVYRYQCVDVAIAYASACFPGVSWEASFGRNNANGHYPKTNAYWESIPNRVGDLTSVPQRGDVVIWGGNSANPYGHIAVVLSASAYSMRVLQQNADGTGSQPVEAANMPYDGPGTGPCVGWLRPKIAQPLVVAPHQREVGAQGVKERVKASTASEHKRTFKAGDVLDFKGYVRGESVTTPGVRGVRTASTSAVWFVGAHSGTYFHASGFTNQTTTGLRDLTPAAPAAPVRPKLSATQRFAGGAGATLRKEPRKGGAIVQTYKPGDVLNFKGYVRGERPYGADSTDVWLVGISGAYVWSGGVSPAHAQGLPDLTPKPQAPAPEPAPKPEPAPSVYTFEKAFPLVTEVRPAAEGKFQHGGMPDQVTDLVVHQFVGGPTRFDVHLDSVIQTFTGNGDRLASAHFGVEGSRVVQFVALTDRAYHAGPNGNDFWSIEVYGGMDAETLATLARLIRELEALAGRELRLRRHREIMATVCGTDVDLAAIRDLVDALGEAVQPDPVVPTTPSEVAALREELLAFATSLIDNYLEGR